MMHIFGIGKKTEKQKKNYEQVSRLHKESSFLCYVNDVYKELYEGKEYIKIEGIVAFGKGNVEDVYSLYSCNGNKKAEITMQELYVGNNKVDCLEGGDEKVALYPNEQDVLYKAGDIIVI